MTHASTYIPRESCPDPFSFSPAPDVSQFSSFLYVLAISELLSLHWDLQCVGLWVSESVHGLFKTCSSLVSCNHLYLWHIISAVFHCQVLWGLLFSTLIPELGSLVWSWDPSSLETSGAEIPPSIFNCRTMGVGPVGSAPLPLLPVPHGFFFIYSVTGILFISSSVGSQWWLFYNLVVILKCLLEEVSRVYLLCHLGWKSLVCCALESAQ